MNSKTFPRHKPAASAAHTTILRAFPINNRAAHRKKRPRRSRSLQKHVFPMPHGSAEAFLGCVLPTPNAPGQRVFLRRAASFFLEIRRYFCEKMSCSTQKFLAAGHIVSWKNTPWPACAMPVFDYPRSSASNSAAVFSSASAPCSASTSRGR